MKVFDKHKNLYYIFKNKTRYLKSTNFCNYVIGFDTETYRGTCKLIADSNNRHILNPNFLDCLNFLFYKAKETGGYRFFYNIDFDITAILKLYDNIINIKKLKEGQEIYYKGFKLYWSKGKFFTLTKNKKYTVRFTDFFAFFKGGLNLASKTYLIDIEKDDIDGNKLNTSLQYWSKRKLDIIKYCIKDCIILRDLAKLLIISLEKAQISLPKMLVSSGSLAKSDFRTNCRANNLRNVPRTIIQIAYDTYYGGKFEIQKKGFFEMAYLYDINSQYPSFIKELYDISFGIWIKVNKFPLKESFGYYKVDLDIPDTLDLSTIPLKLKKGNILTVAGIIMNRFYTWYDLDLMREYITKFHIGFEFKPSINEKDVPIERVKYLKPYKKRIMYHFNKKAEYKGNNEMMYNVHKLTMNALYGSFIERHDKKDEKGNKIGTVGILFNPIYASQITSFGRWSVIKPIPKTEWKNIIAIHTDSIITNKDMSKYLEIGNKIGQWNLEAKGKCIVINTGMYQIGKLVKTRGIPKKFIGNWLKFCLKNSTLEKKEFEKFHMRKISEALIRDKSLINANTMTIIKKTVNINSDAKRHWNDEFKDFKDVISRSIESKLWIANIQDYDKLKSITFEHLYQNPNCPKLRNYYKCEICSLFVMKLTENRPICLKCKVNSNKRKKMNEITKNQYYKLRDKKE